jgi:transcriptional regulator with XRE-family HTH domain
LSKKAKLFYSRYGRAIRALREKVGIAIDAISGLSASQVRRIERGEYRADSKIIVTLAKAHKLTPNEYLGFVANMLAHIPPRLASVSGRYSAAVLWIKINDKTAAILKCQAKRRHLGIAKLSARHLHEKIVEEEFPGIGFRDAVGGREAYLRGHRMAAWEVVDLFNQAKTVSKAAEKLGWPSALVRCTLKYANVFATEVARQRKAAKPDRNFYLTEFRLKQAYERGDSVRRKLVNAEGGSLSATEAARELGISRAAVLRRSTRGTLISWRAEPKSPLRFPAWQFREHKVLDGIEETLKVLDDDDLINDWGRMVFFLSNIGFLGGSRPLDCLRRGELSKVLQAAEGYVE